MGVWYDGTPMSGRNCLEAAGAARAVIASQVRIGALESLPHNILLLQTEEVDWRSFLFFIP